MTARAGGPLDGGRRHLLPRGRQPGPRLHLSGGADRRTVKFRSVPWQVGCRAAERPEVVVPYALWLRSVWRSCGAFGPSRAFFLHSARRLSCCPASLQSKSHRQRITPSRASPRVGPRGGSGASLAFLACYKGSFLRFAPFAELQAVVMISEFINEIRVSLSVSMLHIAVRSFRTSGGARRAIPAPGCRTPLQRCQTRAAVQQGHVATARRRPQGTSYGASASVSVTRQRYARALRTCGRREDVRT